MSVVTDLQGVVSSWWLALEARAGGAAVEDVGAVRESRRRPRRTAVVRSSGSAKARLAVAVRRSADQMSSTGSGSGGMGRQLEDGEPVAFGDAAARAGGQVGVGIVPDQHDRAAELLVRGLDRIAVVLPGEASASVGAGVRAGPVDRPGGFAGLVASQGGDGQAAAGAAPDAHRPSPRHRHRLGDPPAASRAVPRSSYGGLTSGASGGSAGRPAILRSDPWAGGRSCSGERAGLFSCVRWPERHRPASTLTQLVLTEIGEPDDAERPGRSTSPPRPASRAAGGLLCRLHP